MLLLGAMTHVDGLPIPCALKYTYGPVLLYLLFEFFVRIGENGEVWRPYRLQYNRPSVCGSPVREGHTARWVSICQNLQIVRW